MAKALPSTARPMAGQFRNSPQIKEQIDAWPSLPGVFLCWRAVLAGRVPGPHRVERVGPGRGAPRSPAPRTPLPARQNGAPRAGAVGPASPAGRFAEAPAAALLPPATQRECPKSRPEAGAMLISPIFAFFTGSGRARCAAHRRVRFGAECARTLPLSGVPTTTVVTEAASAVSPTFP